MNFFHTLFNNPIFPFSTFNGIMYNRKGGIKLKNKTTLSYIGLIFVIFIWGCSPLITLDLYKYYSPTIRVCFSEFLLVIAYLLISGKHIKEFNLDYIKIGVPTGFFLALANITQKIGLLYTTPARYAFLENLSCISVPILMYFLIKKKPNLMTAIACIVCLASTFVLNGVSLTGSPWGIGEILCAASGLLYGFNIAGTGIYAKKLNVTLYLAVQSTTGFIVSLISTIALNNITITNAGVTGPIEKIMFSFDPLHILYVIVFVLLSSALCWILRTNALKHIDARVVAVISPFSAVITGILSVLAGTDTLDINLILGCSLGLLAIFLSSYEDIFKKTS